MTTAVAIVRFSQAGILEETLAMLNRLRSRDSSVDGVRVETVGDVCVFYRRPSCRGRPHRVVQTFYIIC